MKKFTTFLCTKIGRVGIWCKIHQLFFKDLIQNSAFTHTWFHKLYEPMQHELVRRAEPIYPTLNRVTPRFFENGKKVNDKWTKINLIIMLRKNAEWTGSPLFLRRTRPEYFLVNTVDCTKNSHSSFFLIDYVPPPPYTRVRIFMKIRARTPLFIPGRRKKKVFKGEGGLRMITKVRKFLWW